MKALNLGGRWKDKKREEALVMLENKENNEEVTKKVKDT